MTPSKMITDTEPAGATPAAAQSAAEAPDAPALSPEAVAQRDHLRTQIQRSVGQVVLALMDLPRYRHQSIADLAHIVIGPLLRDRVAIAHKLVPSGRLPAGESEGTNKKAGVAIWATVSDAMRGCCVGIRSAIKQDAKINEQVRAGVFPVRLDADDWLSGNTVWLLDVIAADRRQATSVLANFRQLAGERTVRIHPMVGRMIEPEVLGKLQTTERSEGNGKSSLIATV